MTVSNGQLANASTFNNGFLSRLSDSNTIGKIDLNNTDAPSGGSITNIQREFNSLNSFLGKSPNAVYNNLPAWTNNDVGLNTDSVYLRSEALTRKFNPSQAIGHLHNGIDSPKINAYDIQNSPLKGYMINGINLSGVTGNSSDVSTELTGKTPSTGSALLGVVVNTPYNKVILRDLNNDQFVDGLGNEVYGRLTESVGVWTLSYYVDLSGVETAYSFVSSTSIKWWFQELYNPLSPSVPVYDTAMFTPSENATADVVDASDTQRGLVNTSAQSFSGLKKFLNSLGIRDTSAAFENIINFASSIALTAQRTLTIDMKNADKSLVLSGNADISGTNTGDVSVSAVGASPNANGLTLTGQALNLQPADENNPGALTAIDQIIGGIKSFFNATAHIRKNITSAASMTGVSSTNENNKLTGATAANIHGVVAGLNGQVWEIYNDTGFDLNIANESVIETTAANRFSLSDPILTIADKNCARFRYDTQKSRWISSGGSGGGGTAFNQKAETPSGAINGSNVTFTLTETPLDVTAVQIKLDGLDQTYTTDFSISGTTVTMVSAPVTGQKIRAWYLY